MRFNLRSAHWFVAAVCVFQTLALSVLGHGQAEPSAAVQQMDGQLMPGNMESYNKFIEFVGKEDDRLREQANDGKAQALGRTDYAVTMHVSPDEEQTMLAIVLDAYRREKEVDGRLGCHAGDRKNYLNSVYGYEGASKVVRDEEEACYNEKLPIAQEVWTRMHDQLNANTFRMFNKVVLQQMWHPGKPSFPNPCPPNPNPPPGQTTHLACTGFYGDFFEDFGRTALWNKAMIQEGKDSETQEFHTWIPLPQARKQAVIALGLDAARDIKEAYEGSGAPSQGLSTPGGDPRVVIEEYIAKLRQTLGDQLFKELDTMLSAQNRGIMKAVPASSVDGAPAARQVSVAQR